MPATSDEHGRFEFEFDPSAPPDRIIAVTRGLAPAILERGDTPWPPNVELSFLEPPRTIAGTVFGPDGLPATGAGVWLAAPTVFASYDHDFWIAELQIAGSPSLQHGSTTDEHGRFVIDGLMDRPYALKAILHHSAWQLDAGTFEAGEQNAEIRFPADGIHAELNGRVVHTSGSPVPGARVFVETMMLAVQDPTSKQRFYNSQLGTQAISDADGNFTLKDVPKNATIGVNGSGLIFDEPIPVPSRVVEPLVISVARSCTFRVQLNKLAQAHAFALEDDSKERVDMVRRAAKRITYLTEAPLADGQSEVLSAPDKSTTLILLDKDGAETQRIPITLTAGPMVVIP